MNAYSLASWVFSPLSPLYNWIIPTSLLYLSPQWKFILAWIKYSYENECISSQSAKFLDKCLGFVTVPPTNFYSLRYHFMANKFYNYKRKTWTLLYTKTSPFRFRHQSILWHLFSNLLNNLKFKLVEFIRANCKPPLSHAHVDIQTHRPRICSNNKSRWPFFVYFSLYICRLWCDANLNVFKSCF